MGKIDKSVIKKWESVITDAFKIKNKVLINHICNYSEWRSINNDTDIVNKLDAVRIAINKYDDFRMEIVGEFYNKLTGLIEYKLIDGTFINKNESNYYSLSDNDILNIFGAEYLKYYDLAKYRDIVINDIVN